MTITKNSRMQQLLNWRLKFVMKDGRTMIGQLIAWDRFMNVVLSDCEEFRLINTKGKKRKADGGNEEKRTLGLVILRGENIVSVVPESPPPATEGRRVPASTVMNMPGIARPGGRGMPIVPPMGAPAGLAGPMAGIGGMPPGMRPPPMMMPPGMPGFRPGMPPPGSMPPGMRPPMPGQMPPRPPM